MIFSRFILNVCITSVFVAVLISGNLHAAQEYSLEDLCRMALERSEKIKVSEEDLSISEIAKDKAISVLVPKLSTYASYTRYTEDKMLLSGTFLQPESSRTWGARLDQAFSVAGRELKALKISKENIEKSRQDLNAVREEYLYTVSSAYYDVLKAKKAVVIAKSNVERLTKYKNAATVRLKVGEVTKTVLLRAEAELSGAQSELVRSENNHMLAKAVLARIAGLNGDYELKETNERTQDLSDIAGGLGALKGKAFAERAELKSVDQQRKTAAEQVGYAKGAHWPTLSIEGVYARADASPKAVIVNKESIYGGIKLTLPLFEGGLRQAEVREAEARQRQAQLVFEDTRKTIDIEVERAYLDFMTQKGIIKSNEDQVAFAVDNYNAVTKQFEYGLANSIDVMDANNLLVASEKQLADTRYNYSLSVLKIKRTTGVLLKAAAGK